PHVSVHTTASPPSPPSFPTRRSSDLFAAMPEVALVLGNEEKLSAEVWRRQHDAPDRASFGLAAEEKISVNDIMAVTQTATHLVRSEEHTSELQSLAYLVCRLLLEKKK